jgi:hypothetical protein
VHTDLDGDIGASDRGTRNVEGKIEGSVLLVPEKRVCTRVETAPSSKASAVIEARST